MKNPKIKILITGASGLVGKTASEYFSALPEYEVTPLSHMQLDITDKDAVFRSVSEIKPAFIINCAAYTQVDRAEKEKEKCFAVNVQGAVHLAEAAELHRSTLIHLSTDYVFDGEKKIPYSESDPKNPLNHYGLTKSLSEDGIAEVTNRFHIIRPAWIYGKYGDNFFTKLIRWARTKDTLQISNDQISTPTYAGDLTAFIDFIIRNAPEDYGIYHFTGEGQATRYEQAVETLKLLGIKRKIVPVSSGIFKPLAKRPPYSVLSKEKIKTKWNYPVKHWKESLKQFINQDYDNKS
jgi:dTDP-4-dehydrorhamnose reductase